MRYRWDEVGAHDTTWCTYPRSGPSAYGLELGVLLGGVDEERRVKQRIVMDLWFTEKVHHSSEVDYATTVNRVIEVLTTSQVMGRCRVVLKGVGDRGIRISDTRAACP